MSKLAIAQYRLDASVSANLDLLSTTVSTASKRGSSVVLLPELCLSHYFPIREHDDVDYLSIHKNGPEVEFVCNVARENSIGVVFPFFEKENTSASENDSTSENDTTSKKERSTYFNSALYINEDGEVAAHYRKRHIPYDPYFFEKNYFQEGDLGPCVVDTPIGKLGILICWDQWFPEAAREVVLMGAEVIVFPTAIGWLADEKASLGNAQLDAWITIQRSHAIANGVFVAAANRIGVEVSDENPSGIEFWGNSFCVGPFGERCAELGQDEGILIVDIDTSRISEVRQDWPFLRDRRDDYRR